jgi:signal transduction histidine kinase
MIMKSRFLLIISMASLLLFVAVQIYLITSIWRQKEALLTMQYKSLSREGLSMLLSKKKSNGFEKAMDVTDKFTGYLIAEELSKLSTSHDTSSLRTVALQETRAVMEKNEKLTGFLRSYIKEAGYDSDFKAGVVITKYALLTPTEDLTVYDTTLLSPPKKSIIPVNTFKEEHNNFAIEYLYYIDITHKNELVLKEAFFTFILIIASIIIVFLVFGITWRNLMEERRLSELKSDFINNMTHELKTPLSTITVAGRTLEKEQINEDPGKVLETARLIGKQSVHLNQLINTILEVSFLERTEFELDRQKLAPDELIHQIVSSFLTACNGCAEVEEDYRAQGLVISADIVYFTTMINNLLTNAVKYCDKDPVIKVSTDTDDHNLIISVSDNGIGIPREHIDHIFEKFYRVPHGNIHKIKGLGLGLYYVKRIAISHGGDVDVSSKPGHGTTFRIKIPT